LARVTRTPQQAEPSWKPRPWDLLTLAVAFAALLLAGAAYFNSGSPEAQDDFEVRISGDPDIAFRKPRFVPAAEHTVTFTNGGARTAIVQSMELVIADLLEDGTDCDNLGEKTLGAVFIPYDLGTLSVPAGETVARKTQLRKAQNVPEALEPMFPDTKKQLRIIACYRFVVSVAGTREVTMIEAGTWIFDRNGALVSSELNDVTEPQALLSQ
jgi:hypothetical protein